jgi:putative ABC transport system permease protein
MNGIRWLETFERDVYDAFRSLWRAKGFAAAAVSTLAIGIAGTTVMFALVHGVLLRPLPVHDQDRLIVAWKEMRTSGSARYPFGNTEIEAIVEASQLLEHAAGVTRNGVARVVVTDAGVPSYANVGLVTGGFFDVLGVRPLLGRSITPADERAGAENVIVISAGFWQRRYGGSREIVGRSLLVGERPFTIVGVMPPDLDYPSGVEIWRTTHSVPTDGPFGDAARREVNLIARLRPGVTVEQATSEIVSSSQRLDARSPPSTVRDLTPVVRPFAEVLVGDVRLAMLALSAAVGLVLLIATANLGNLLLMRGEGRRGELALRTALGAGRARIISQVFAESVAVAVLAGVAGVTMAWWGLRGLIASVPDGLPRVESIRIDGTVVAFSIGIVLVAALVAGLIPALASLRADLMSSLRSGGHGTTGTSATLGRRSLVVAQVALAVIVVAVAGLLIRSVLKLQAIELGLAADRLVLLDLHLPPDKYSARHRHAQFLDELIARLEGVPGIAGATPVNIAPFSDRGWDVPRVTAEGQDAGEAAANPSLNLESIFPNYFDTLEVAILRGRAFTAVDREDTLLVAIVSDDVAAQLWPDQDPIGKRVKMGPPTAAGEWRTVVGVAAPTRYRTVTTPRPTLYLPATQLQMTATMLVVRSAAPLELLTTVARDGVRSVDPDVQLLEAAPFAGLLHRPLARPRFNAVVLSIFGVAALLLSVIGLYAVMAAHVDQRTREIALRLALGSTAAGVSRLVLYEAVRLAGAGAAVGVAAAAAITRLLRGMLFEVNPLDPSTMAGAALLLVAASAIASYAPVRRATRVDAASILRGQ